MGRAVAKPSSGSHVAISLCSTHSTTIENDSNIGIVGGNTVTAVEGQHQAPLSSGRRMTYPWGDLTLLDRFKISDYGADLIALEPELGHVRVTGNDAFAQRFFESLNRIAFPERRNNGASGWVL
jgi:hypothetical protein